MRRILLLGTVFTAALALLLPFAGGGGPSLAGPAPQLADGSTRPVAGTSIVAATGESLEVATSATAAAPVSTTAADATIATASATTPAPDTEHLAQKPVPPPAPPVSAAGARSGTNERRAQLAASGRGCPGAIGGAPGGAPGRSSAQGVAGTTSGDLASFAAAYNAIRVANCLAPIPFANFRYDSCMEDRLFWMAEDPSTDPASAWGHAGSVRSDGVPSVGCDGNLAGGSGNSGATVAQKWWTSDAHRASLYRPGSGIGGVCITFAMTHGGVPNEPASFTRAAARWVGC